MGIKVKKIQLAPKKSWIAFHKKGGLKNIS